MPSLPSLASTPPNPRPAIAPPRLAKLAWPRDALVGLGLALLIAVAYWPVARNDFINYDDDDYVVGNEFVNRGLSVQSVAWAMTAFHDANWHPLTWLSHMIDCQLFGPAPAGHHLVNLGLHAVNSMLLYCVLLRMTRAAWPSLAVAAFFAVHPLHVESVAWVAERKDVLSTMFGLWPSRAWLSYLARPGLGRYSGRHPLVCGQPDVEGDAGHAALSAASLDYWPLGRAGSWGQGVGSREQGAGSKGQGVIQSSRHTPCAVRPCGTGRRSYFRSWKLLADGTRSVPATVRFGKTAAGIDVGRELRRDGDCAMARLCRGPAFASFPCRPSGHGRRSVLRLLMENGRAHEPGPDFIPGRKSSTIRRGLHAE